jgi:hypothetical protein
MNVGMYVSMSVCTNEVGRYVCMYEGMYVVSFVKACVLLRIRAIQCVIVERMPVHTASGNRQINC